jgi:uncharacterized protein with HEPN domain
VKRSDGDHATEALEHIAVLKGHVDEGSWGQQVVVDAVCLRLAAAIDAASRISEAGRRRAFGSAWAGIRATRNRIAHGYATIDEQIVRATVENDLTAFTHALEGVVRSDEPMPTRADA